MRLEYSFSLSDVSVPRLSVEAVEGIGKLFTLATLVLNILDVRDEVELVFHGLNPDDPARKIEAFQKIVAGAASGPALAYSEGSGGAVPGSSSYYQWVTVTKG